MLLYIGFIALQIKEKMSGFAIKLIYLIVTLFLSFFILLHLSTVNAINTKYKWAYTMIPIVTFNIAIIVVFVLICFELSWYGDSKRNVFNLCIILGFLSFISSIFLLFFHFIFSGHLPVLSFFVPMQVSLVLLLTVALMAITENF